MQFDEFFHRLSRVASVSSQRELAALLGVDPSAITRAKARGVPRHWATTLAATLGLNPHWLRTGTGSIYHQDAGKTVYVPMVSARVCAGGGSLDVADNVIRELPFERSWVSRAGRPESMVVMEVVGDSMSPELEPGDAVLIDQGRTTLQDGALFVVGQGDVLQVKRIQARPGLVILFSTNQRYSPVTLQGDEIDTLRVIGRVLWSSRSYV